MIECGTCGGERNRTASSFVIRSSTMTESAAAQNKRVVVDRLLIAASGQLAVLGGEGRGHDGNALTLLGPPEHPCQENGTDADGDVGDVESRPASPTDTDVD